VNEPAVTLTDYALALECTAFAVAVLRSPSMPKGRRAWLVTFFGSAAGAAFFGGTVHGFLPDPTSPAHTALWTATLLAIGVTAFSGWGLGAALLLTPRSARWIVGLAGVLLGAYTVTVSFVARPFWIAIAHYLPATLFLLAAFAHGTVRGERRMGLATAGLALTVVAAALQRLDVALHPGHFDANALYHAVQAVAFALIFVGVRPGGDLRQDPSNRR